MAYYSSSVSSSIRRGGDTSAISIRESLKSQFSLHRQSNVLGLLPRAVRLQREDSWHSEGKPILFTISAFRISLVLFSLTIHVLYNSNVDQSGYTITGQPMPSVMWLPITAYRNPRIRDVLTQGTLMNVCRQLNCF
jgi:hypothetical protein